MRIKAIIFDFDNTIVNADEGYISALQKIGIDPTSQPFLTARAQTKSKLPPGHTSARNRLSYIQEILRASKTWTPKLNLDMMAQYEDSLAAHFSMQFKKLDRSKLFKALKQNYRLSILTNENLRTQLIKLSAIDPRAEVFEHMITSEEYGVEKTNPRLYHSMLDYLQMSENQVVMVGDDYANDIVPALKLGMTAIYTTEFNTKSVASENIDPKVIVIKKLDELLKVLK